MKISSAKKGSDIISVKHTLIGVLIACIISIVGAGIFALLVGQGSLGEDSIKYFAPALVLLSSFVGCVVSGKKGKEMIMIQFGTTALIYFLVLICVNIVFFSGEFSGVIVTVLAACLGAVLAGLLKGRTPGRKKFKRSYRK